MKYQKNFALIKLKTEIFKYLIVII